MGCRMDVGAHHACWLLLQALFMTASVPKVTSIAVTRTMNKGLLMVASRPWPLSPAGFSYFTNEPGVNVLAQGPLRVSTVQGGGKRRIVMVWSPDKVGCRAKGA